MTPTTHSNSSSTTGPRTARVLRKTAALGLAGLLAVLLAAPAALAQVCGDVNGDDVITASDAQRVLRAAVHLPVELICSSDECAALEARVAVLEALLANLQVNGNNLVLTGMNLQVVSGSGKTDGTINGKGNIIVGYDESDDNSDKKTGSHNLVIGRFHSYPTYGGIVAGEDNEILAEVSSVLGGARNQADGDGSVIVGGFQNETNGEASVVLAGESNRSAGRSCSIASGFNNVCTGVAGGVSGGINNLCTGNAAILSGGSARILNTNGAWLAGGLFQSQ